MIIRSIKEALNATVIEGNDKLDTAVKHVYASDLMSDVLAFGQPNSILLTGLATRQAIISSHIAEFCGVVLIRDKLPKDDSEIFAKEHNLVLLSTKLDMYDACIKIESIKRKPFTPEKAELFAHKNNDILISNELFINGNDFANAGMVSTEVKSILKKIGLDPQLTRRVAIATYEGEMNVMMHAKRGKVILIVTPQLIEVVIDDEGKGIPDIKKAMQKGFTTATEEMRAMGFGSGMGLPNIKKNADNIKISSKVGKGTRLEMKYFIK